MSRITIHTSMAWCTRLQVGRELTFSISPSALHDVHTVWVSRRTHSVGTHSVGIAATSQQARRSSFRHGAPSLQRGGGPSDQLVETPSVKSLGGI